MSREIRICKDLVLKDPALGETEAKNLTRKVRLQTRTRVAHLVERHFLEPQQG